MGFYKPYEKILQNNLPENAKYKYIEQFDFCTRHHKIVCICSEIKL